MSTDSTTAFPFSLLSGLVTNVCPGRVERGPLAEPRVRALRAARDKLNENRDPAQDSRST